jgi:hypothetical protein
VHMNFHYFHTVVCPFSQFEASIEADVITLDSSVK